MSNQEPREEHQQEQQEQQREDHTLLRSERKARGEVRDAHLEAGRGQALSENARARERNSAGSAPAEDARDDDYEAKRKVQKEVDRAAMKAEARSRYEGSDAAFERDWPDIREQLVTEKLEKDLEQIRRGL